jgi:hypothetical protein
MYLIIYISLFGLCGIINYPTINSCLIMNTNTNTNMSESINDNVVDVDVMQPPITDYMHFKINIYCAQIF